MKTFKLYINSHGYASHYTVEICTFSHYLLWLVTHIQVVGCWSEPYVNSATQTHEEL